MEAKRAEKRRRKTVAPNIIRNNLLTCSPCRHRRADAGEDDAGVTDPQIAARVADMASTVFIASPADLDKLSSSKPKRSSSLVPRQYKKLLGLGYQGKVAAPAECPLWVISGH
jgi:hypothetical protein